MGDVRMVIVGGGRSLCAAVVTVIGVAGAAEAQDARDAPKGVPQALYGRFVEAYGSGRLEALATPDDDAGRGRSAAWLSRWIELNRPGSKGPVSPALVPFGDPDATR